MHVLARATAIAVISAVLLAGPAAAPASAETKTCGGPGRPPCSILRPAEAEVMRERTSGSGPRCIVVVGGFDSTSGDRAFDDLLGWTGGDPSVRALFFGADRAERFSYDTTGPLDENAETLGLFVRSLKTECSAFDLITHSMGGAVADRAFAKEWLSAADGVETYIALSGPHNGATVAKALRAPVEADPIVGLELSTLARAIGQPDPTSPASRDLARLTAPHRVVRDVLSGRMRLATDPFVLRRDTLDRRVETREYLPELAGDQLNGHGGVLETADVRRAVRDTLTQHQIPSDARDLRSREIADVVSRAVDAAVAAVCSGASALLLTGDKAEIGLAAVTVPAVAARAAIDALARSHAERPDR